MQCESREYVCLPATSMLRQLSATSFPAGQIRCQCQCTKSPMSDAHRTRCIRLFVGKADMTNCGEENRGLNPMGMSGWPAIGGFLSVAQCRAPEPIANRDPGGFAGRSRSIVGIASLPCHGTMRNKTKRSTQMTMLAGTMILQKEHATMGINIASPSPGPATNPLPGFHQTLHLFSIYSYADTPPLCSALVFLVSIAGTGQNEGSSKNADIRSKRSPVKRLVVFLKQLGAVNSSNVCTHNDPR